MSDSIALRFDRLPSFLSAYRRILFGRRSGLAPGARLPSIFATCAGVAIDRGNLRAYTEACAIGTEPGLPMHYPHVLIGPIHMNMLSHRAFPLGLMGAVHLRNHALRYRPIQLDDILDIECTTSTERFRPQGIELDITTRITCRGDLLWHEIATMLIRKKSLGRKIDREDPPSPLADVFSWPDDKSVVAARDRFAGPAGAGKRYGRISGDFNPIHMSRLLARLFGFRRDLVHGMWGVARATREIEALDSGEPVRADVAFKGPLYISQSVAVRTAPLQDGLSMRLFCGDEPRPAALIAIRTVSSDTTLGPVDS